MKTSTVSLDERAQQELDSLKTLLRVNSTSAVVRIAISNLYQQEKQSRKKRVDKL